MQHNFSPNPHNFNPKKIVRSLMLELAKTVCELQPIKPRYIFDIDVLLSLGLENPPRKS